MTSIVRGARLLHQLSKRKTCVVRHSSCIRETQLDNVITFRDTRGRYGHQRQKRMVILFGWAGASYGNLKKYSALFEIRGYSTVIVQNNILRSICLPGLQARKQVDTLLKSIRPHLSFKDKNPVILFAFSHIGCMLYIFLARALQDRSGPYCNLMDIKGAIFDSSPVFGVLTKVSGLVRGLPLLVNNPLLRQLVRLACYVLMPFMVLCEPVLKRYVDELYDNDWRCPQLFLYSKADSLRVVDDIRDFALHRQDLTVTVRQKCWEDSPHCRLLDSQPLEYEQQISKFLALCSVDERTIG